MGVEFVGNTDEETKMYLVDAEIEGFESVSRCVGKVKDSVSKIKQITSNQILIYLCFRTFISLGQKDLGLFINYLLCAEIKKD